MGLMNMTEDHYSVVSQSYDYSLLNITSENITVHGGFLSLFSSAMDKLLNGFSIIILFITMTSLGCTLDIGKIRDHFVKPKGVAIAMTAQFGIMPLVAFCLAKVFQLESTEAVTVLICGCCPGGNLSNILSLAIQGDMNLSIVMTTCSTVMALVAMPFLLYMYCQSFHGMEFAVPYVGIIISLITILMPCAIGISINHWAPRYSQIILKVGMRIWITACVAIGVLSGIAIGEMVVFSPQLMAVSCLMPFLGFLLGYKRTIAMETGCQNVQLCFTILKVTFSPEVIGPLYLFPLIYFVFQVVEALLFIILFRCYQRCKPSTKVEKTVPGSCGQTGEDEVL
ncbi:sodium/bile acid cotransporter-like isoform X2 [Electrophorus electricus]|uniref:sodium/bile acid cotransporter-like isoform X2 n=1 Tax=Electrophorus electricus TaxID=8005 RepID=UPI0015D049DE|nr:sodium/bile acid cotransporter-like isoform X2 [Electrophorus electricus]